MRDRRIAAALVIVGLLLPACAEAQGAADDTSLEQPARLEPVEGTDLVRIVLSERGAERIGLQTTAVRAGTSAGRVTIPHAAVFYGLDGDTWTYTSPESLTFVREPITVARIDGDTAYLSTGPPPGTPVVTVGAAELFGVETEISG